MSAPTVPTIEPEDGGAALLDEVRAAVTRYVVLPSVHAVAAVVLWIAATHAQVSWEHAPRLVLTSPEKRCGKSRCQDVIAETCHKPLITVNATVAAIVRSLGDNPPTLIVDEADTIFGTKKQADNNEDLRGILNAGHQRNRPMLRWDITTRSLEEMSTFAMACLASIGNLPDTIEDRAVVVRMRRRAPGELVAPYRTRRDSPKLNDLRDKLADWVDSKRAGLVDATPAMPVEDRAADTWEPLIAIADAAGGDWPTRARTACLALVHEQDEAASETSMSVRLLADIRDVFKGGSAGFWPSTELLGRLVKIEDAPWSDDSLTTSGLAARLRQFGVKPGRNTTGSARGYQVEDFADAFARYLNPYPSEPVRTRQTAGQGTDDLGASDGSTRQTAKPDSPLTWESDDLTGSDALYVADNPPGTRAGEMSVCAACRQPMWVIEDGQTVHPMCEEAA